MGRGRGGSGGGACPRNEVGVVVFRALSSSSFESTTTSGELDSSVRDSEIQRVDGNREGLDGVVPQGLVRWVKSK